MNSRITAGESFPVIDETTILIEKAGVHADRMVDLLFDFCRPLKDENEIRESLLKDLLLLSLTISDDTDGTVNHSVGQYMEYFWLDTWSSYTDPAGEGIDQAKADYLCLLAHSLYTDEVMRTIPAAIAGSMHEPHYIIDRTIIDGASHTVMSCSEYVSLHDVVTEYEKAHSKATQTETHTITI